MSGTALETALPPGSPTAPTPAPVAAAVIPKTARGTNWRQATVLSATGDTRRLWRFKVQKDSVGTPEELKLIPGKPLPDSVVGKGWNTLMAPSLNVAWLPADQVFLQILQLPSGPLEEVTGVVELQLDKISPHPSAHTVWSVEILPNPDPTQQTVLVVIVPRERVQEHLGELEKAGFVPDRLAVPFAGQLRELPAGDGLWVLTEDGGTALHFLLAWRVNGIWREVSVVTIPQGPGVTGALISHLTRLSWAGELAGWLPTVTEAHLVAPASRRGELESALSAWRGGSIQYHEPVAINLRAASSATAQLRNQAATLVPAETQARHRQQVVDRLWLQGLGAVGMAYLLGVVIYLGLLNWQKWDLENLQSDNVGLALQYTNTLATKAQKEILEEQVALRYAALESWQQSIEKLPASLNLSTINFVKGRTLRLDGTTSTESQAEVVGYGNELRKLTLTNGVTLFSGVKPGPITVRGSLATWSLEAELNRSELP